MKHSLFEIINEAEYSNLITGTEYHTHKPYASNTFNNNYEIRIPVNQQDTITAPFESYIYVRGKLSGKKADGTNATCKLVNYTIAFLFDSIRYEIATIEVDRTKKNYKDTIINEIGRGPKCPLFVIDCSKQDDTIKSGPIDVRIEFETDENIPNKTSTYCLISHDCHIVYTPLTGSVRRLA